MRGAGMWTDSWGYHLRGCTRKSKRTVVHSAEPLRNLKPQRKFVQRRTLWQAHRWTLCHSRRIRLWISRWCRKFLSLNSKRSWILSPSLAVQGIQLQWQVCCERDGEGEREVREGGREEGGIKERRGERNKRNEGKGYKERYRWWRKRERGR
jgi:hypothetical protein